MFYSCYIYYIYYIYYSFYRMRHWDRKKNQAP